MLTELFEMGQIIRIKMDLGLNNQQWLICHKTQTTNQQIITSEFNSHWAGHKFCQVPQQI